MTWTGPGFVDQHCHVLLFAGADRLYIEDDLTAHHQRIAQARSTPADRPWSASLEGSSLTHALEQALNQARRLGLVEITEMGLDHWSHFESVLELRERNALALRVNVYVRSGLADESTPRALASRRTGDAWIDIRGVKFYSDGWLGPRTCAVGRPFRDAEGMGILFMDATTLARRAEPYAEQGLQIATHAIGDRATEAVLDAYEMIFDSPEDCMNAAPRIEHAQVMRPELIDRLAEWGVVVCMQPAFGVSDAAVVRHALDDEYIRCSYDWSALLQAGVNVIAGSDYTLEPLAPLSGLQQLVTGKALGSDDVVAPVVAIDEALSIMTDANAGVVTLSADPRSIEASSIAALEVIDATPSN